MLWAGHDSPPAEAMEMGSRRQRRGVAIAEQHACASVPQTVASPTIHHPREQLVEDVVIEPATARARVRAVVDESPLDLEEAAWSGSGGGAHHAPDPWCFALRHEQKSGHTCWQHMRGA
jgi:hypothetical protein